MKPLEQVKAEYKCQTIDGRDIHRLAKFVPFEEYPFMGIELKEGITKEKYNEYYREYNRENIIEQLRQDVAFGFEKALDQRGISASCMAAVVMMWNDILQEGLEGLTGYAQYGLPIFKATALKYGFPNPIGEDSGEEDKYATVYE